MIKFMVVWCLFGMTFGSTIPNEGNSEIHGTIIGGNVTKIEDVPYQVALFRATTFVCGGSIITNTLVITAGHCVNTESKINLRVGSNKRNEGGVMVGVKKVHLHPKFAMIDYDVAILELSTPLNFTNKVKAIKVGNSVPADGQPVKVSGWGVTKENGAVPISLQSVTVPIVNWKVCQRNYNEYLMLTDRMICAGVEGKDACYGDSGGPLIYKDQLVGVVSTGFGCGRKGYPGVYTNVAHTEIRQFIKNIAKV